MQNYVRRSFENLYPDDNRNIHPENYYIWETQNDDRVREKHFERHGQVFSWDNPPEGGHPGEDYGCRCSAKPYKAPKKNKFDRLQEISERLAEIESLLTDLNEEKNHKLIELDDLDNEIIAVTGALGLVGAGGVIDGVEDAVDIKGDRIYIDYDKIKLPNILIRTTNGIKIGVNIGSKLYEHWELVTRLEQLTNEREKLCQVIIKLNEKIALLEEEKQQLFKERENLETNSLF